jgi:hypothetical protein
MCFSAPASFAAGIFLLGVGTVTWRAAEAPNERPFAAIPLLFGIQQLIEGVLWLTFSHQAPLVNAAMTYAFSFFSLFLWPVLVPVAVLLMEPPGWRRKTLRIFVAAGILAGGLLLYTMTRYGVVSCAAGQHIDYEMPLFFPMATMLLYLLSTSASELLSTHGEVKIFGMLALLAFGVAYIAYTQWFISVWCYFAAALSAIVLLHFKGAAAWPKPIAT